MKKKGFTLLELAIVIAMIVIVIAFITLVVTALSGNGWYTESSVLKTIQVDHKEAAEVLTSERNFWSFSVITVRNQDDSRAKYLLGSNILFNYTITPMAPR